jgi:hypothetical protein
MATRKALKFDIRTGREIHDDDPVLRDGQRIVVPMNMADSAQREVIEHFEQLRAEDAAARKLGLNDALDLHKPGQRFSVDAAARARVEQARAEGIREMCDAWKQPMADIANEARGAQPGDECTVREGGHGEGSPGHLQMRGGRLVCVPDKRRADSVPRTMDAAAAQQVKDQAWLEMCRDLEEAWKR